LIKSQLSVVNCGQGLVEYNVPFCCWQMLANAGKYFDLMIATDKVADVLAIND
jgi:hypothetical protein